MPTHHVPFLEVNYKKFGHFTFQVADFGPDPFEHFKPYIKILFVPRAYQLSVDFKTYITTQPSLFFININQILDFSGSGSDDVQLLFYNRDFYCVQIHDAEVACDGLLFNNIFQMPYVPLDDGEKDAIGHLFKQIELELQLKDPSSEEMIRTYLKQIIIRATRIWKEQNLKKDKAISLQADQELFRNFGRLVEIHFREKHRVADYAELLYLAPKTLANKFHKMQLENPNEIIKNRIVLEAKRLLHYTGASVKEIAYQLGYDDPAYFNRLFTQKAGVSPNQFRKFS